MHQDKCERCLWVFGDQECRVPRASPTHPDPASAGLHHGPCPIVDSHVICINLWVAERDEIFRKQTSKHKSENVPGMDTSLGTWQGINPALRYQTTNKDHVQHILDVNSTYYFHQVPGITHVSYSSCDSFANNVWGDVCAASPGWFHRLSAELRWAFRGKNLASTFGIHFKSIAANVNTQTSLKPPY